LEIRSLPSVQAALAGLRPVVLTLISLVVIDFAPRALSPGNAPRTTESASRQAHGRRSTRIIVRFAFALAAFVAAIATGVHPGVLILAGGSVGVALHILQDLRSD